MPCRRCPDGSWVCDARTLDPCSNATGWITVRTEEQLYPAGVSNVWCKPSSSEAKITMDDPDPDSHPDWTHVGWVAFEVAGEYKVEYQSQGGERFRVKIEQVQSQS